MSLSIKFRRAGMTAITLVGLVAWSLPAAATSIGTDISTNGALTVTGSATLGSVKSASFLDTGGNDMLDFVVAGADSSFYMQNNSLGNNPILGVQATSANQGMTMMLKNDSSFRVQSSNAALDTFQIYPSHSSSASASYGNIMMKEDLTANRDWTFQNASGVVPLGTAANSLFLTTAGNTNVTLPTTGTLATLAGIETFTNKTLTSPVIVAFDGIYTSIGASAPALGIYGMPANVNYVEIGSGASGGSPGIAVKTTGASPANDNIGLDLGVRGTGVFRFASTAANSDWLVLGPAVGGADHFTGKLTSADLTANRQWTLPDADGTIALVGHAHAYLPTAGGTMSGAIDMGGQNITNANSISATSFSGSGASLTSLNASNIAQGSGSVGFASAAGTTLTVDSGTNGNINFGVGGSAKTVTVSSQVHTLNLRGAAINLGTDPSNLAATTVNLANLSEAGIVQTVNIGSSANVANSVNIAAGSTGGVNIGGALALGAGGTIVFEGATADNFEGVLTAGDPVADYSWNLPGFSGTLMVDSRPSVNSGTATASGGAATLDQPSGTITTESLATATPGDYTLTVTNSYVAATSRVMVTVANGSNTQGVPFVGAVTPGAGSFVVKIINPSWGPGGAAGQAFNGTLMINFVVFN